MTFDEVVTARKERSQQYKRKQMRFLLLPGSRELNFWRASMVVVVLLAVVLAPLEMAFSYSRTISSLTWLYRLIDILFILDMIITFNVATTSHGRLETKRKTLAMNYARTWLVPDFFINFPWDLVLQGPGKTRKIAKILKLPKVFRVTRLLRAAGEEAHYFGTAANICGILLMGHYLSCIWVMLLIDCTIELDAQQLCPDMLTAYLQGLSVGLATLGGSDGWMRFILPVENEANSVNSVNFEWPAQYGALTDLTAALSCLMGFVLLGMLFSNLAHAMDRRHSHTRLFHARVANLQAAANQHQIPKELYSRIKRHYYYVWSCGSDTSKAILADATLSLDLRRELAYCFYGDILKQVPFLEMVDKHFLQQLCEFVEIEIFAAQDRIICAGDVGTELYFVAVGEVEVVLPQPKHEKGPVIKILHEGSFFGELGLLFPDSKHKVDVYGATAGWLLVVPRGTLETLCTEELLETFRFVALERIRKQPEMGSGMMMAYPTQVEADVSIRSTGSTSQESGSEEWSPHDKAKDDEEPKHAQVKVERPEIRKSRSLSGRMDLGGVVGEPSDLHAQLKRMTCRTEFFRKPQLLRRQTITSDSAAQLTGVGYSRRASLLQEIEGSIGSSTPYPLLQTLHKVEHGMNTLLSRMHTMEMNVRGDGKSNDDASEGGTS